MRLRYFLAIGLFIQFSITAQAAQDNIPKVAEAEQYLQGLGHYERLSGVVLVARGEEILYQGATGWANVEAQIPMTTQHVLGVGSLSKQFTATAVVKLVAEGKLSVHDPVITWLPGWADLPEQLTLHHLLTHTSGLNRDIGRGERFEDIIFPEEREISLEELLGKFADAAVEGKVGDEFDYNNLNYSLLAAVVEKASQMPFEDYVQQHLFEPNHLQVFSGIAEAAAPQATAQYMGLPQTWELANPWHWRWLMGAGNFALSAHQMNDWISALQDTTFLPREYAEKLTQGYASEGGGKYYGYGWEVSKRQEVKRVEHDGAVNGYVTQVIWLPESDLRVVVMTNHTHDLEGIANTTQLVKQVADNYLAWAQGEHLVALPAETNEKTALLPGQYELPDGRVFWVEKQEGALRIVTEPWAEPWSVLDYPFLNEYTVEGRKGKILEQVALGFGHTDYRQVLRKSSLVIRVLLNPERLGGFWDGMVEEAGAFESYRIYRLPEGSQSSTYWVALIYEQQTVGLSLYFKRNRINGMFIDQQFTFGGPAAVSLLPIADGRAFVDGFRLGYADAWVSQEGEGLLLEIQGNSYRASRVASQ